MVASVGELLMFAVDSMACFKTSTMHSAVSSSLSCGKGFIGGRFGSYTIRRGSFSRNKGPTCFCGGIASIADSRSSISLLTSYVIVIFSHDFVGTGVMSMSCIGIVRSTNPLGFASAHW